MIGLNLLPDVKKEFIKAQRTRNVVISVSILTMLAVVGVTVFLALFAYVGQALAINGARDDIEKNQKTLENKPEIVKYLTIQQQLDTLSKLESKDYRAVYSRLMDYLPQLNPAAPNSVRLSSVLVQKSDTTVEMKGMTKDFESLGVFKNTLENAKVSYVLDGQTSDTGLFTSVTLKTASISQDTTTPGVQFELSMKYSPDAFLPNATDIRLDVPKLTLSDAKSNAPNELFQQTTTNTGAKN